MVCKVGVNGLQALCQGSKTTSFSKPYSPWEITVKVSVDYVFALTSFITANSIPQHHSLQLTVYWRILLPHCCYPLSNFTVRISLICFTRNHQEWQKTRKISEERQFRMELSERCLPASNEEKSFLWGEILVGNYC